MKAEEYIVQAIIELVADGFSKEEIMEAFKNINLEEAVDDEISDFKDLEYGD